MRKSAALVVMILLLTSLPMLYTTQNTAPNQTAATEPTETITAHKAGGTNYTITLLNNQNFTGTGSGGTDYWNYEEWGTNTEAADGYLTTGTYYSSPAAVTLRMQYTSRDCELGWTQPFTYTGTKNVTYAWVTFRWRCTSYTSAGSHNHIEIYLETPKYSGTWRQIYTENIVSTTGWNYRTVDISSWLKQYGANTYQFEADAHLTTSSSGTPMVVVRYDDVGIGVGYTVYSPPSGLSATINSGAQYTNNRLVTLSLAASGAEQMRFSNDSVTWTTWEPFATTKQVLLTSGDGTKTVYFAAKNTVTPNPTPVTDTIIYDYSAPPAPSLTSPANGTAMKNNAPTFTWTAVTDPVVGGVASGLASYTLEYSTNKTFGSGVTPISGLTGTSYTPSALADGTWYWRVRALDNANNPGSWSSPYRVIIVDTVYPAAPTLVSPTSGIATNNTKPNFTWSAASDSSPSSGIANYTLQLDTTSQFNSGNLQTIPVLSGTNKTLTSALADGTWYWRVRATDKAGNAGGYAAYWVIVIDTVKPSQVTLSSPSNSQPTNINTPTFTWSAATDDRSGVASYTLQLDTTTSFNSANLITRSGLTGTSYTLTGATLSDNTWYWHVRAVDNGGNLGDYSTYRSIIVDTVKPLAPGLLTPPTGTNSSSSTPTFTWSSVIDDRSGVASYTLQLDTSSSFSSGNLRTISGLTSTSYTATSPLIDGKWYWHVRAVDNAGNFGDYSTSYYIVVVDTVYPPVPTLLVPATGTATSNNKPPFTWSAVVDPSPGSGIAKYYLQLDTSSSFNSGNLTTILVPGTSSTYTPTIALTDGTWYWRVNATDYAGNKGGYSGYWSLIVDTLPPSSPSLSLPIDNDKTKVNTPLLVWSAATDATSGVASYTLQLDTNSSFNNWGGNRRTITGLTGTSYTVSPALIDGTWYWRVNATDYAGNKGSFSSTYHFMVDTIGPVAPSLVSPSHGSTTGDNTPDFKWHVTTDSGSGVATYTLQLDTSPGFGTVNRTTITGLTGNYTLTTPLGDGVWYWHLMAVDIVGNNGPWSTIWNLTVDTRVPNAPTLLSPANGYITNDNTTALEWTKVSDASSYDLYVDESSDFAIPFIHKTGLTGNYTLQELLNEDLGDGNWYWKVVAVRVGGNRSSTVWGLLVDMKNPNAPSLTNPGSAAYTNDTTPTFTWDPASDPSPPSGIAKYYLQLDTSSSFNSGNLRTILVPGTSSTYTPTTFTLIDGTWYWRVNATDQAGNVGSYSTVWNFVVDTLPPTSLTLSATCGSYTNTLAITLNVGAVGADRIYLSNDGSDWIDYPFAASKAWTLTAGDGAKQVYFKCKDAAGNWAYLSGGFISITLDTIAPIAGIPSNPASGSATNDNTTTFQWSAGSDSSGIANYTFQYSQDPTFSTGPSPVTVPGSSLTYTVTSPLEEGTWYWRVRAIDNAGNVGGYSGYSTIIIDTVKPNQVTLSSPSDGLATNSTLTLTWNAAGDATSGVISYYLQIDTSSSFNSVNLTAIPVLSGTSYILTGPLGDDTWYWRVNATDRAGNRGLYSTSRSFIWDTQSPTILSLSLGGSFTNTLTITVTISASGTPQKMYLSNDGNDWAEYDYAGSKTWTLTAGDGVKQVYFKCKDAAGNWAYLSPLYRTITLDTIPPTAGSLLAPASGLVTNDNLTTFQWSTGSDTGGSGVTGYYLQYSNNPLFSSGVTTVYRTLTSYTVSSRLSDGTWYWRVNATDSAGNRGYYSPSSSFTIDTIPPGKPPNLWPANASMYSVASLRFNWTSATGGYTYRIQIDRSMSFSTSDLIENSTLAKLEFSPAADNNRVLTEGIWYWHVEAIDQAGNHGGYSAVRTLIIDVTPPSSPSLLTPADSTATKTRTKLSFAWSPTLDAASYWFQLDLTSYFNSSDLIVVPGLTRTDCVINKTLVDGRWHWRVFALDSAGNINNSILVPMRGVIIDTTSPSSPFPQSPTTEYLTPLRTLTISWYPASDPISGGVSSGIANYTLWLDNSSLFDSPNLKKVTGLTSTNYATPDLSDGMWYWLVFATDNAGNLGPASLPQSFIVDTIAPAPPTTSSMLPNSGMSANVSKVTFSWAPSWDLNRIAGYEIQINISDNFTSPLYTYSLENRTSYTPDDELANGNWYWRIRAVDAAGNHGVWSEPIPFVVNVAGGLSPMMVILVGGGSSGLVGLAVLGYVLYRRAKIPFVIKKIDQSIKLISKGEMPPPVPMKGRAEIIEAIFQSKVAILSKEKIEEFEAKKQKKGKKKPEKPEEPSEKEAEVKQKRAKTPGADETEEADVDMIVKELEKLETREEMEPSKESDFIKREMEELEKAKKKKKD